MNSTVFFIKVNCSEAERRYSESKPRYGDPSKVEFLIQNAITLKKQFFDVTPETTEFSIKNQRL